MWLKRKDNRKKSGGIIDIFRLFLSLIIMFVLAFGLYQAYISFSGLDPLKVNPKSLVKGLASSDKLVDLLTGLLTISPGQSLEKAKGLLSEDKGVKGDQGSNRGSKANLEFKFAVVSDPHLDTANLKRALNQAKGYGAKFIIGLGDFSNIGTIDELNNIKKEFDTSNLPYYVTAGDHDLWESRNEKKLSPLSNFQEVFGYPYQAFSYQDARFIIIYNSDDYLGLDGLQLKWVEDELNRQTDSPPKLILAFVGTPLYHPSSDHAMGRLEPKLKNQADHLIDLFKKKGVKEVFAGDTHFFSRYTEPKLELKMTTVGAITADRNPQTPRFAIVEVYEDGSYTVEETEVK